MKTLRFPAHLVLQLLTQRHATHLSSPLLTPDGTLIPADIQAIPEPGQTGAEFRFPHERLVLYATAAPTTRICIKERWKVGAWKDGAVAVDYAADGHARREWLPVQEPYLTELIRQTHEDFKRAGHHPDAPGRLHWQPGKAPTRWRRSNTMRMSLSRAAAVVTHTRAVRVSDLTQDDALAAGMAYVNPHWLRVHSPNLHGNWTPVPTPDAAQVRAAAQHLRLIERPDGPTPLERLHADLHRRHGHSADTWLWATDLQLLPDTPIDVRRAEAAEVQEPTCAP